MSVRFNSISVLCASLCLAVSTLSFAADPASAAVPAAKAPMTPASTVANKPAAVNANYTALLQKITQGKVQILKQFTGPGDLVGLLVRSPEGQKGVVYVDKNAQYVIIGNVIMADGSSRSADDTDKYVNSEIAQKAWGNAAKTAWVLDGSPKAKHVMYAIGDPNCSACHRFYSDTRPYVNSGDLAIRWIWVGFMRPTSPGMAMAIISAKDPGVLMKQNEQSFNEQTEAGAVKPLANPSPELKAKFDANMKFMAAHQFTVTPTLIFQDAQGKAHTVLGAVPEPGLKDLVNQAGGAQ